MNNDNSTEKIINNPHLLTEILINLPTKSLVQFKCVSKQWLSLISNPHFYLSYTRRRQRHPTALLLQGNSPGLLVVPLKHHSNLPSFDYLVDSLHINWVQSCNGLFLCRSFDVSKYLICNPTTKKFKQLFFPRIPISFYNGFYVSLAFDPLKSPHYNVVVVREVSKQGSHEFEMDVYASENDEWDVYRIAFETDVESRVVFGEAVFCNGKIHWNSYRDESLCFDVEAKCLEKMPMPTTSLTRSSKLEKYRYLGETNGSLYLGVTYRVEYMALDIDVHQMASDYSHWFLKHSLNLGDAMEVYPVLNSDYVPLISGVSFVGSDGEDEAKVVMWVNGKIIWYDFHNGAWKMVFDPEPGPGVGPPVLSQQRFIAFKYIESLSCV